jgi:hypothetical protein
MADYLIHYNKNHSKANGQFVSGDGDGDGIVNDNAHRSKTHNADGRKKGVYSAKVENYKKGNAFRDPYYIDKRGNKRSYQSYKEMPVDAQRAEKARANGKKVAKRVATAVVSTIGAAAVTAGAIYLAGKVAQNDPGYGGIDPMGPIRGGYFRV